MFPQQFTSRMKEMLKDEYEAFAQCYDKEPYHSLRINTLKGSKEQYDQTSVFKDREPLRDGVAWEQNGFYYEDSLQPGKHPFHEAGVYYIQEASAMAPAAICKGAEPDFKQIDAQFFGERILDLCAAPGGKSTQMAAAMEGRGILFSNEIHPTRAKILSENIERMGITNAIVLNHDPKVLAQRFPSYFHRILVDAPCSGEGMFRKNEEAVEQWSQENVRLCAQRQEEILECAYEMLMGGGILVYSTCTFAPEEDEEMVAQFLLRHPDMKLLPIPLVGGMKVGNMVYTAADQEELTGTVRLWPHKVKGEGHFAALLRKEGIAYREVHGNSFSHKISEAIAAFEQFEAQTLNPSWREGKEGASYLSFGDQLYLVPQGTPDLKGLKVLRPGLHLGTLKKDRFEPSHALALSLKSTDVKDTIDLSIEDAIKYIEGYSFPGTDKKGWCLVTVEGYSLGFGKAAGGSLKNHYPKGLRKLC